MQDTLTSHPVEDHFHELVCGEVWTRDRSGTERFSHREYRCQLCPFTLGIVEGGKS